MKKNILKAIAIVLYFIGLTILFGIETMIGAVAFLIFLSLIFLPFFLPLIIIDYLNEEDKKE